MIHPLFAGFNEFHHMERVAEGLGFEVQIELFWEFNDEGVTGIDSWSPEVPEGFELAGKWDSEEDPFAMFVKPTTSLARVLWAASAAEADIPVPVPGDRSVQMLVVSAGPSVAGAAVESVYSERLRQLDVEGWSHEHDDKHVDGELMAAAICYLLAALLQNAGLQAHRQPPTGWPWAPEWWKPADGAHRNLVKAGALVLAELERTGRAETVTDGVGA